MRKKLSSQIFDWVLNTSLVRNIVKYKEKNLFVLLMLISTLCGKCPNAGFFSGSYFPIIGLSPNTVKYRPEKTPYFDTFTKCRFSSEKMIHLSFFNNDQLDS